ncbi:hypothetical protein SARC_11428 [Sphaeroforma arctica JP610]|uniref:Uncharacterized protein n=1 Tax=Sphaeroforma arctica JP610 TaxID=667725 RepID=A0A0L0FH48_9EUKA|nr:hypothetical protein SARC_11428 [Sphaeroforma arctica JP610]KNC76060.1 hypothetical protein SARC_11428 [Sphaeroforma arctica JP610]|eukprot:XP_014149962.1 hypothetical protein SARC_11428 [Sphaeroforma arctica JP610]
MQQPERSRGFVQYVFMDFADLPRTFAGYVYLLLLVDQLTGMFLVQLSKSTSSCKVKRFLQGDGTPLGADEGAHSRPGQSSGL